MQHDRDDYVYAFGEVQQVTSITTISGLQDALDVHMATCCTIATVHAEAPEADRKAAEALNEKPQSDRHNLNGEIARCFVRYANRYADNRSRKHCLRSMKRAVKRCSIQAHDANGACGLFLIDDWIIGAVLTWCIEKCLDWLWDWWQSAPEMTVQTMACGLGCWQDEDSDDAD